MTHNFLKRGAVAALFLSWPSAVWAQSYDAAAQERRYLEMQRAQENQPQDLFHQQQQYDRESAGYSTQQRSPYE